MANHKKQRCEWYKNEKSCFDCPYPDCVWNAKLPTTTKEKPDALTVYKERLEDKVRQLGIAVAEGDARRVKSLRNNIRYYKRCIERLENMGQITGGKKNG